MIPGENETSHLLYEDGFVSPVVITAKNDKSVKTALDSRKVIDNCIKYRPHGPNLEERLNNFSVEVTNNRTKLMISTKDLDYAHGQKTWGNKPTMSICHNGRKF